MVWNTADVEQANKKRQWAFKQALWSADCPFFCHAGTFLDINVLNGSTDAFMLVFNWIGF